jgi:serine/threonine-protein kinase
VTEEISSASFGGGPVVGGSAVGGQVAGYQIEAEVGRGGMATVYRARDVKLGRPVALKILAPRLAEDESFRRRFIHESRAAAAVDHPHIVPVFEAGESGGVLFIAMRYVGSGDVRTLLQRHGRLPVARAVAITAQMASAIDAAHARGLVHRDIKPANMLLAATSDGRGDHVYLSDFGLSKDALAPSGLTSTGQFMGTLDYVAPEQIEGRSVDGRADQYALACTTVEMLTGAPPFRRDENLALMWAQLSEPPPLLHQRRPDLPPAIDQVIHRALAKSPGDRYLSCTDFAAALRTAAAQQPGPRRSGGPYRGDSYRDGSYGRGSYPGPSPVLGAPTELDYRPGPTSADLRSGPAGPPGRAGWSQPPDWSDSAPPPARRAPARTPRRRSGRAGLVIAAAVIVLLCLAGLSYKLLSGPGSTAAQAAPGRPAATGRVPRRSAAGIVRAYFRAIDEHDYYKAWQLGGRNSSASYRSFASGFDQTAKDAVRIMSASGDIVTVRLTATQTDGTVRVFQGTYTIGHGQIVQSNISRIS